MSRKRSGEVDTESAKRGIWLVKVPRYLSELWEANEGTDVARLVIGQGHDVKLRNRPGLVVPPDLTPTSSGRNTGPVKIPEEHTFLIRDIMNQTMCVLSEDKAGLNEEINVRSGRLAVEGRVVKRGECRPPNDNAYLKMKIAQIEKRSKPDLQTQQITGTVVKFKPINQHAEDMHRLKLKKIFMFSTISPMMENTHPIYYCRIHVWWNLIRPILRRKNQIEILKEGAKTVRLEKDQLLDSLFHLFEKHQYYRLLDLQRLTNQPAGWVKEVLQEIAVYNTQPPHKSMWELKPEYRNYAVKKINNTEAEMEDNEEE